MFRLRPKEYKSWLRPDVEAPNVAENRRARKTSKNYEYRRRREQQERPANILQDNAGARNEPNIHHYNDVMETGQDPNEIPADNNAATTSSTDDDRGQSESEQEEDCHCFHCLEGQQDPCKETCGFDATEEYAAQLKLDEKLSPALDVSKFDVLLMILTITMRHGMTGPLIEDLLKLVNSIVGSPSLPTSDHIFKKIFSVDSGMAYHFVCDKCNLYLGEHTSFQSDRVECGNCKNECNVKPSTLNEGTFFITLSVQQQLQEIVRRAGHYLIPRHKQRSQNGSLGGVHDGKLLQSLTVDGMPLSDPYALTLTIATDGGQVFQNSCRNSMWPVQAICNELTASERYRPENMILAGLWFGKSSPDMSAFLKPIAADLTKLETEGVNVKLSDGRLQLCPVFTVMCVCDSVAKPKLQNIVQFNGYFGCGYCVQRGVNVADVGQTAQVRFPYNGKNYQPRSEKSVRDAMTVASETSSNEKGVVKRLIGLWFDESSHGKRYYIKKFEDQIDERLSGIVPPSRISTRPTAISKRSVWKAKDYANFLLYWGLPTLDDYLPHIYLENFKDLSHGVFLLLKECISQEDLEEADFVLTRFLQTFNQLYGDRNMVYNLHLVSHLVQMTKMCGPLCYYSAFSFESGIGLLARLVKGTNSVASQICRKYLVSKSLPHLLSSYNFPEVVHKFCQEVMSFRKNKNCVSLQDLSLLGGEVLHFLTENQRQLILDAGYNAGEYVSSFNRAIFQGKVIASKAYKRPKRTNDTCVQLKSGAIGFVEIICLVSPNQCVIFFSPLRLCPGFEVAKHIHVCAGDRMSDTILISFHEISRKCIYYSVNGIHYVTYRPNEFEKDN